MTLEQAIEEIKKKGLENCPYAKDFLADLHDAENNQDDMELRPEDLELDPYGSDIVYGLREWIGSH